MGTDKSVLVLPLKLSVKKHNWHLKWQFDCFRVKQKPRICEAFAFQIRSSAIVTEGQSRATDGARPNNASIVACKLFDLQGEFKFGVRKKRKNTNKVRAYLFVVRSPRLELGRCNHTPLKRTRLPIPPWPLNIAYYMIKTRGLSRSFASYFCQKTTFFSNSYI